MDQHQHGDVSIETLTDDEIEGYRVGSNVSVIVVDTEDVGSGPELHQHPYPETFVVLQGTARFEVGGQQMTIAGGSVVVAPANTPHRFENAGPGRLLQVDIHGADRFDTEWLAQTRS